MSKSLAESMTLVTLKIKELLQNEAVEGGILEGVKTISLGEKNIKQIQKPALWIFRGKHVVDDEFTRNRETWIMPYDIMSIYRTNDFEEGYLKATELAVKARSVLLKDKKLKYELDGIVKDVKSVELIPTGPYNVAGSDFAALYKFNVRIMVTE